MTFITAGPDVEHVDPVDCTVSREVVSVDVYPPIPSEDGSYMMMLTVEDGVPIVYWEEAVNEDDGGGIS